MSEIGSDDYIDDGKALVALQEVIGAQATLCAKLSFNVDVSKYRWKDDKAKFDKAREELARLIREELEF